MLCLLYPVEDMAASTKICLTGRIVKSLPTYGESFVNAVNLAISENDIESEIIVEKYFYDNKPLEPLRVYYKMIDADCNAIIGYSYLSDLLLIVKHQKDAAIPIFSPYASSYNLNELPRNIFIFRPGYGYLANKMFEFVQEKKTPIKKVLVATEINRNSMQQYKQAYIDILNAKNIEFDVFDFLETDVNVPQILQNFLKEKGTDYQVALLLSGAVSSALIANYLGVSNLILVGTENFGSEYAPSFYYRRKNNSNTYFIRNLSFLSGERELNTFEKTYCERFADKPTLLSVYAYDATNIMSLALKHEGKLNADAIYKVSFKGLSGVELKNNRFRQSRKFSILSVHDDGYRYEK